MHFVFTLMAIRTEIFRESEIFASAATHFPVSSGLYTMGVDAFSHSIQQKRLKYLKISIFIQII